MLLPLPTVYSESKFLAEQLLLGSASLFNTPICRVGLIAGPALSDKGAWKKDERLPSVIKSNKYLKLLPESLSFSMTELDWKPVDLLSTALWSSLCYPVMNPQGYITRSIRGAAARRACHLPLNISLVLKNSEIVPFGEWVETLRKSTPEMFKKQDFEKNPATNLLDLFAGLLRAKLPRLSMIEMQKRRRVLRDMMAVESEDMQRWMRQWGIY